MQASSLHGLGAMMMGEWERNACVSEYRGTGITVKRQKRSREGEGEMG